MKASVVKRSLVVGLGSPLSRADAFGLEVVGRLECRKSQFPRTVDLVRAETDLIGLIEKFPEYDHVILVDAVLGQGAAGVVAFQEETFQQWPDSSPSVHHISPLVAVRLFRKLYPGTANRITLVACCVDWVGLGTGGGPDERLLDAGVRLVLSLVL